MLFVCYPKCTTCRDAKKWLGEHHLDPQVRDIKTENPSSTELKMWHELSGLPIKKFYNTSGNSYRELGLKEKFDAMSLQEHYDLLATDGMLVKRPIVVKGDTVVVGFKAVDWEAKLL